MKYKFILLEHQRQINKFSNAATHFFFQTIRNFSAPSLEEAGPVCGRVGERGRVNVSGGTNLCGCAYPVLM